MTSVKQKTDRAKARQLYEHGGRTVKAIADKLGIPVSTVKSWKARDGWNNPDKNASLQPQKGKDAGKKAQDAEKRRKNPHYGNMNAVGHGAKKGTRNHMKTGAYCLVSWDCITDEEREFLKKVADDDTEMRYIESIGLYQIRERRILKAINSYLDNDKGMQGMYTTRTNASEKRLAKNPNVKVGVMEVQSTKSSVSDVILRLERELTSVQRAKTVTIGELEAYRERRSEAQHDEVLNKLDEFLDKVKGDADETADTQQ